MSYVSELLKTVETVGVEVEHGVHYVWFAFRPEAGDQDGVIFQWSELKPVAWELYMEVGGQAFGMYDRVLRIHQDGMTVRILLKSPQRLPYVSIKLDCADIDPELVCLAVNSVAAVLASN